jgi:general secretion pathway protein D
MRLRRLSWVAAAVFCLAACEAWPPPRPPEPALPPTAPHPTAPTARPGAPTALPQAPPRMAPIVERGTGVFVKSAPARPHATVTPTPTGAVTLNMVDADLREVVRMVLGDTLHVNYVIDPSVGGTITVQTSHPVARADLLAVLDAILRVNGAALVEAADLYKVVPIDQAMTSGLVPGIHPAQDVNRPGFGVVVVPLRFVSAATLAPLLQSFVPPGGSLQADPERNVLLLAGTEEELGTLTDLVSMFDVDWLAGMSFGLYPLEFAKPTELVAELQRIFALDVGPASGVLRFLPIERLSAVLVMSSQPTYLDRAAAWLKRLDKAGESGEPQVFVYPVQNGRAADLAQVLGELFNVQSAAVGPQDLLAPGLQPASIGSSQTGQQLGMSQSAGELGGASSTRSSLQPLQPSRPTTLAQSQPRQPRPATGATTSRRSGLAALQARTSTSPSLNRLEGQTPGQEAGPEIRIIADSTTNSLVIWATPRDYRKIRKALAQLDILPLQVLIEATVAEVKLNNELRYGVEWFLHSGDFSATFSRLSSTGSNLPGAGLVQGLFPGFSAVFSNSNARVVLNALESVTDVNVVSSPHLLVLDNQTARIQVGDQVPITVQQATSVVANAPIVNSIELRDTGVILSVTPRVNASGLVVMELQQEVSNVVPTTGQTTSQQTTPTIAQRQISSTVAVQSGETIALGGLIEDHRNNSSSGVPFLSRLPIIGPLFGTRDRSNDRTELLVLLTPRVVRGIADARAITDEMRRRLRTVAPLVKGRGQG